MDNNSSKFNRRTLLKGLAAIPAVAVVGFHRTAAAEMVDPAGPTATALNYTEKSTVDGQTCANCGLYQGGDAATGPCPIFGGKDVPAGGWCKSWVAKS